MSEVPEYILKRVFNAPVALVWKAWTTPELLQRWYGPGAKSIVHKFDLQPDGLWLNEMAWGEKSNFQKVIFKEVVLEKKVTWHHHSCTDANWEDMSNPMMPDWPRLLFTEIIFTGNDNTTTVLLKQVPMDATQAEIDCFTKMMSNMDGGWGSGYKIIDEIIQELQE